MRFRTGKYIISNSTGLYTISAISSYRDMINNHWTCVFKSKIKYELYKKLCMFISNDKRINEEC